ncbi:hypothetical protein [Streptomyces chartreusis]|uniref:hypothetical protein n=1 Tax=Streptomyces chartreusis TaxID=1969 RepID=UPI003825E927
MRDESRRVNDELGYYKTDKLLPGSTNFPAAANLMAAVVATAQGLEKELMFANSLYDRMVVALAQNGDAMEQAEEHGSLSSREFGRLVGEAITGSGVAGGGSLGGEAGTSTQTS